MGIIYPSPSVFGRSVNPIQTKGADYAHHITKYLAPALQILTKALYLMNVLFSFFEFQYVWLRLSKKNIYQKLIMIVSKSFLFCDNSKVDLILYGMRNTYISQMIVNQLLPCKYFSWQSNYCLNKIYGRKTWD